MKTFEYYRNRIINALRNASGAVPRRSVRERTVYQ